MLNKHDNEHNLIDINNKEALKSYNISIEKTISEFDEHFKRAKNIKYRIEEEIGEINNSYKKIINEMTEFFEEERIKLYRKETQLKSELEEKIKQIKESLEKNLIEANDLISFCEKTNKAIEYYQKKINSEEIEKLYYISEINKTNDKVKECFIKPFKNLEVTFNSELKNINYKEYYFNGIPVPKNIQNNNQGNNTIIISWEIDDFKIRDYDIKNIKYLLEIKNGDKLYSKETSEKRMTLVTNKLNKNYEIKIRVFVKDIYGNWSNIENYSNDNTGNSGQLYGNTLFPAATITNNNSNENPFLTNNNFYY